jgi:hypothetical protein
MYRLSRLVKGNVDGPVRRWRQSPGRRCPSRRTLPVPTHRGHGAARHPADAAGGAHTAKVEGALAVQRQAAAPASWWRHAAGPPSPVEAHTPVAHQRGDDAAHDLPDAAPVRAQRPGARRWAARGPARAS